MVKKMPKLIDADKIKAYLQKNSVNHTLTVDAVEVVRCKDCLEFKYCLHNEYNDPNGFCAWGERREDDVVSGTNGTNP